MAPTLNSQPELRHDVTGGRLLRLALVASLLATVVVFLVCSAILAGPRTPTTQAAVSDEKLPEQNPSPTPSECLQHVAWPDAFSIPFTAWVSMPSKSGPRYVPWKDNTLFYEYDEQTDTVYFRSQFKKCINLPGVPLSFFGKPCEFLFPRNPQNSNQYDAYVYSSAEQKYFLLAKNLGPQAQDFVARYQKLLPAPCLRQPFRGSKLPVGNPPGVTVNWFITSGSKKNPPESAANMGYYAAIANPVMSPGGQYFKPPYSFAGSVPGVHKPRSPMRMVAGQLIYDWQHFSIVTTFQEGTFTPPAGYTEIKGCESTLPPMSCPACHLTDPSSRTTFYIEAKRNPKACATPQPR